MRIRTALLLLILAGLGVFAALNWAVFTTPAQLHLIFARVEAPLGVVMLVITAGVSVLYGVFMAWIETSALLEARRYARELNAQRQLAESAETSRYGELRKYLDAELGALRTLPELAARDVIARLDRVDVDLHREIERAGNTLAAYIGELEGRLERGDRPPGSSPSPA